MVESRTHRDGADPSESLVAMLNNWPPRSGTKFDWNVPTNEAYHDPKKELQFHASFQQARAKLDYTYHLNPQLQRQKLQDKILKQVLHAVDVARAQNRNEAKQQQPHRRRPWIIFTAGPMAAGKSYALSQLHERDLFPLDEFVAIDPDKLKSQLPEMAGYLKNDAESAATKLHRESTQMADVLFEYSLLQSCSNDSQQQLDILVDGSLRDVAWYQKLFTRIRKEYPAYRLGILYVSAEPDVIRRRAALRAQLTGRAVPDELLQASMDQVPRSVQTLAPLTDVTCEISNNDDQPIELVQFTTRQWKANDDSDSRSKPSEPHEQALDWNEFAKLWNEDDNENDESITDQQNQGEEESKEDGKPFRNKFGSLWKQSTRAKKDRGVTTEESSKPHSTQRSESFSSSNSKSIKMMCQLLKLVAATPQQLETAKQQSFGQSFPGTCSRCVLLDGHNECGPCVHNNQFCRCEICHPHDTPPCAKPV